MFALTLALALLPSADPKDSPNPRQVAEKYLAAALADKPEDAVKLAEPGKSTGNPDKVKKFKAGIGVERLALPMVFYSDKKGFALAVSEEIKFPQKKPTDLDRGVIVVTLKRNKDGVWQVNDLDARTSKDAEGLLEKAKKLVEDGKELPSPKS